MTSIKGTGQSHVESCTVAGDTFCPDAPAMQLNQVVGDGKPETRPTARRIGTGISLEDGAYVIRGNT